jgi:hypothetical protein
VSASLATHRQLVSQIEAFDGALKARVQCTVQCTLVFLVFSITQAQMDHQFSAHMLGYSHLRPSRPTFQKCRIVGSDKSRLDHQRCFAVSQRSTRGGTFLGGSDLRPSIHSLLTSGTATPHIRLCRISTGVLMGSRVYYTPLWLYHTPPSLDSTPCAYLMRILLVASGDVVITERKGSSGMQ